MKHEDFIKTFQRRAGLAPDGIVGPNTIAALEKAFPDALREIPPHPKVPFEVILGAIENERRYSIPASVTLAQWALESGWGKSASGKNNFGGITARVTGADFPHTPGRPLEPATLCWTHEVVNKVRVRCKRWFKDFATMADYFEAHGKLLGTSPIYAEARSKLPDVDALVDALAPGYKPRAKDPNWKAYATDPNYATTLKSIIRTNGLRQYDGWAA